MPDDNVKQIIDRLEKEVDIRDKKIDGLRNEFTKSMEGLESRVNSRLDEINQAVRSVPEMIYRRTADGKNGKDDWKVVAVVVAFLGLAFGLVENQIMTDAKIADKGFEILKETQHENTHDILSYIQERAGKTESEVLRIRDWKDKTEENVPKMNCRIDALKESMVVRTGLIDNQIVRLEEKLTFLTKELLRDGE